MKIRYIAPLAMVAAATAIGLAPLVAAESTTTTDTGAATLVQSPGNAQLTTQPGAAALQAGEQDYPFSGDGGLLFHHGGNHGGHWGGHGGHGGHGGGHR
jgi:hypothetical protein